jgi:hypothetical protein
MSFPDVSHSAHHGNKGLVACVVYPLQDFGSTCGSSPLACCMESNQPMLKIKEKEKQRMIMNWW